MIVQEFGVLERHTALMLIRELAQHPELDPGQAQELKRLENLLSTNDPSDLAAITRELRTMARQLDDRQAQLEHFTLIVGGPTEGRPDSLNADSLIVGADGQPASDGTAEATSSQPLAGRLVGALTGSGRARVDEAQRLVALVAMSTVIGSVVLVGGLILVLGPAKLFVATPLAVAALVVMFKALGTVARQHRLECEVLERAHVRSVRAALVARGVRGSALEAAEQELRATLTSPTSGGGFSLDRALRGRG